MKKHSSEKLHHKLKLPWILASIVIVLAGISYLFIKANTVSPSINVLTASEIARLCQGDKNCIATYNTSKAGPKDAEGNDMAISKAEKIVNDQAKKDKEDKENLPKFCSGGSGVKLPPGSYVASGGGWEADGKTTCTTASTSCPFRKCVKLDEQCNHGTPERCDTVADKSKLILPVGAGPEYTVGKTTAQIKAEEAKTNTVVVLPEINSCLEKGTLINRLNGYLFGNNRCLNGKWVSDLSKSCDPKTQTFDPITNTCNAIPQNIIQQQECETRISGGEHVTWDGVDCKPTNAANPPNCSKEGYSNLEGIKVYVTCSSQGKKVYHFCTGGTWDTKISGKCNPPAPSTTAPNTNLPSGTNLMIVSDPADCPNPGYFERHLRTDTTQLHYICQDKNNKNLDKDGKPIVNSDGNNLRTEDFCYNLKCNILIQDKMDLPGQVGKCFCQDKKPPTPENPTTDQPPTLVASGKGTKVGGQTDDAAECKYTPKPLNALTKMYNCPTDLEYKASQNSSSENSSNQGSALLPPGANCANGSNNLCASGDCRRITNPSTNTRGWYCMATSTFNENTYDSTSKKVILRKNSYSCFKNSECASNYCADNRFLLLIPVGTCENNPFQ